MLCLATAPVFAEEVLRKGNAAEPETLDPHKVEGVNSSNILRDLYEGLTGEAPNGDVVPGAAEGWEVSADGRQYLFHLRANGRWSNGDAVTAQDFVAGFRRGVAPATGSAYAQILAPIENAEAVIAGQLPPEALGVEALDELTLRIRLKGPTPYFLGLLNHSMTYPVHGPSLRQYGSAFARAGTLIGNGAYRLSEWVVQSHVTLTRNSYYWDNDHAAIDKVVYYPTENQGSELKRYRAGELDWTDGIPLNQAKWIKRNLGSELQVFPYLGVYYYGFNLSRPPFKDAPQLRQALGMAIDRPTLVEKIVGTGELPAYGWVPPGIGNYTPQKPAWADWPKDKRLAEARRLYAEAGYSEDHPLELEIRYNTAENHKKIAIAIAFMWKQALGVKTRLVNEEWKVFLQNRRLKHGTQVFRAAWVGDYNDAYTYADLMHSDHGLNDSGYSNPAYDALLAQVAMEPDANQRRALLEQAERMVLDDLPVIPIYFYVTKRLVKPYVTGWGGNIMDHHYTKNLRLLTH